MIHSASPFSPFWRRALLVTALALLIAGCSAESESETEAESEPSPVEVPVREVALEPVSLTRTYTGRTAGAREVNIRARVDGVLAERRYTEGSVVEPGMELFRIDPAPYEVQVQRAEANLARAEAEQRQAEREWERVAELYEDDAASARERDEAQSELELAEAGVALAEAELEEMRIDLEYTSVDSPLHGVAGMEESPEGTLVDAGDLLTRVTQLDPIHVQFSISETHMNRFGAQIRSGTGVSVDLALRDGSSYDETGRIDFTEASVDETTGTVRARAVFDNPGEELLPGQFVRLSLSGLHAGWGYRIPQTAVLDDPDGDQVFIVDDEDRISLRAIEIGLQDGDDFIVAEGLEDGERIVVDGVGGLSDGDRITPQPSPKDDMPERPVLGVLPPAEEPLPDVDPDEVDQDNGDEDNGDNGDEETGDEETGDEETGDEEPDEGDDDADGDQ